MYQQIINKIIDDAYMFIKDKLKNGEVLPIYDIVAAKSAEMHLTPFFDDLLVSLNDSFYYINTLQLQNTRISCIDGSFYVVTLIKMELFKADDHSSLCAYFNRKNAVQIADVIIKYCGE